MWHHIVAAIVWYFRNLNNELHISGHCCIASVAGGGDGGVSFSLLNKQTVFYFIFFWSDCMSYNAITSKTCWWSSFSIPICYFMLKRAAICKLWLAGTQQPGITNCSRDTFTANNYNDKHNGLIFQLFQFELLFTFSFLSSVGWGFESKYIFLHFAPIVFFMCATFSAKIVQSCNRSNHESCITSYYWLSTALLCSARFGLDWIGSVRLYSALCISEEAQFFFFVCSSNMQHDQWFVGIFVVMRFSSMLLLLYRGAVLL